jgi:hypothetical protein
VSVQCERLARVVRIIADQIGKGHASLVIDAVFYCTIQAKAKVSTVFDQFFTSFDVC